MNPKKLVILILVGCLLLWAAKVLLSGGGKGISGHEAIVQAEAYLQTFQYDGAITLYRQGLTGQLSEEDKETAHFGLGTCLQKSGKNVEAIAAYEEAIRLYPRSRRANTAQGEVERIKLHHNIK